VEPVARSKGPNMLARTVQCALCLLWNPIQLHGMRPLPQAAKPSTQRLAAACLLGPALRQMDQTRQRMMSHGAKFDSKRRASPHGDKLPKRIERNQGRPLLLSSTRGRSQRSARALQSTAVHSDLMLLLLRLRFCAAERPCDTTLT